MVLYESNLKNVLLKRKRAFRFKLNLKAL